MQIFETAMLSSRGEIFSHRPDSAFIRSVCTNIREAWAKRRYEAHFVSKLTDADGENGETDTWLDFAHQSGFSKAIIEVAENAAKSGDARKYD